MQNNRYKKLFMALMMVATTWLTAMNQQEVKTTAAGVVAEHKRKLSMSAEESDRPSKKAKVTQEEEKGVILSKSWENCPTALCTRMIEMAGESVIDMDEVRLLSAYAMLVNNLITFACDTTGRWVVHAARGSGDTIMLSIIDLNKSKRSLIGMVQLLAEDIVFKFSADAKRLMGYSARAKMLWVWDVDSGALSYQTSAMEGALLYADGEKIITHQRAAHTVQMYDSTVADPTVRTVPLPDLNQFNVVGQPPVVMTSLSVSNVTVPVVLIALSPKKILFFDPVNAVLTNVYDVPLEGLVSILSMEAVKAPAGSAEAPRLVITGRREVPTSGAAFTAAHPLKRSKLSTVLAVVNMQTAAITGGMVDIVDCLSNKLMSYSADKSFVFCFQHTSEGLMCSSYNIFTNNMFVYPYTVADKAAVRFLDVLPMVNKSGALELAVLQPQGWFNRCSFKSADRTIDRVDRFNAGAQFQSLHAHALADCMLAQAPHKIGFLTSIWEMAAELAKLPVEKQRLLRHICCSNSFREKPLEITAKKLERFPEALQRVMIAYGTKIVAGIPRPTVGEALATKAAKVPQAVAQSMSLGGHGSSGQLSAGDRVASLSGARQEPGRGFSTGSAASAAGAAKATPKSSPWEMDQTED